MDHADAIAGARAASRGYAARLIAVPPPPRAKHHNPSRPWQDR